jgi:Ca-activated chloride channel family protein
MNTAVLEAMRALRDGAQRQVVLITDGYIGGEQHIVTTLRHRLPASCRLHVVGVGAAPNRTLSAALARAGRGAEILIGLDEDRERVVKRLLDRTCAPVLTDVTIEGSAITSRAPEHAPDVYAGAPMLAALQVRPEGGEIVVRGTLARGEWVERVRIPAAAPGTGNRAIPALFARERVADLDVRFAIGDDVDRTVERIGIDFQIATRMTSWVAIDDGPSVDRYTPERHEFVPQELPYGTEGGAFGLTSELAVFGRPQAMARPSMVTRAGGVFKDSSGLIDLLHDAEPSPEKLAASPSRSRPRLLPLLLALGVVIALIALLIWWLAF